MTAFVLRQLKKTGYHIVGKINYTPEKQLEIIESCANFLSQPLTLQMFIPCDLEGNVLKEPDLTCKRPNSNGNCQCGEESVKDCREWWNEWTTAKEKVLFSGFELIYNTDMLKVISDKEMKIYFSENEPPCTIEAYCNDNLTLTEKAKKQIGII